jgi:RNA polymerase sigma-70 factor, ECF subfamily
MSVQAFYPSQLQPYRIVDYDSWTDSQLISACQDREPRAFKCLRKRYLRLVAAVLKRLAPERRDNDDLMQEVFMRVWNSIKALRNPLAFRSWLNQIATNCFYTELRQRPDVTLVYIDCPLSTESGNENAFTQIRDPAALPDEIAESRELAAEILWGLMQLAPETRRIILLRLSGLSYGEIAVLVQTELGTVKSRLSRARSKLKAMTPTEKRPAERGISPRRESHLRLLLG